LRLIGRPETDQFLGQAANIGGSHVGDHLIRRAQAGVAQARVAVDPYLGVVVEAEHLQVVPPAVGVFGGGVVGLEVDGAVGRVELGAGEEPGSALEQLDGDELALGERGGGVVEAGAVEFGVETCFEAEEGVAGGEVVLAGEFEVVLAVEADAGLEGHWRVGEGDVRAFEAVGEVGSGLGAVGADVVRPGELEEC